MAGSIARSEVWLGGLTFAESPRWHDGRLWFSDMHDGWVCRADPDGRVERVHHVEGEPSGLGWLPDGRLLVVEMHARRVLRFDAKGPAVHADLSPIATWHCNDMVVDVAGRAYIGNFGADWFAPPQPADLACIAPDGTVRVAAPALDFPNGCAITPDGHTLLVAETKGGRIVAFDVDAQGALSNKRTWAQVDGTPDGICLDADGALWVAAGAAGVLRLAEGGAVLDRVEPSENLPVACMLGGEDRKTLFICTTIYAGPEELARVRQSKIERIRVETPGVGRP